MKRFHVYVTRNNVGQWMDILARSYAEARSIAWSIDGVTDVGDVSCI